MAIVTFMSALHPRKPGGPVLSVKAPFIVSQRGFRVPRLGSVARFKSIPAQTLNPTRLDPKP